MNRTKSEVEESVSTVNDAEIELLLQQLTEEELENFDLEIDPDNSLLPANQRCRDQTKKEPTGPLNRQKLITFLEDKAKQEADWEERVPFEPGVKRGNTWKEPDDLVKKDYEMDDSMKIELDVDGEFAESLKEANERDWIDLAGILGLHSLLSQTQYYNALTGKGQDTEVTFSGVVKFTTIPTLPDEEPNKTNIDECIERLRKNDATLTEINLNNLENDKSRLGELLLALVDNTHVKDLSLCNTNCRDRDLENLVKLIENNDTLKVVNIESNYLSPVFLTVLAAALAKNKSIVEFRADNQAQSALGYAAEVEIANCLEMNDNLLRLGLTFRYMDPRYRVADALERNYEQLRLRRLDK